LSFLRSVLLAQGVFAHLTAAGDARAWVFSEHTSITSRAMEMLAEDASTREPWAELLPSIQAALGVCAKARGQCVGFEHLPALAGDHSCTPQDLSELSRINRAPDDGWVPKVVAVSERTATRLKQAGNDAHEREAARRQMHIDLQGDDARYLERALVDFSHFQLARETRQLGMDGLVAYLRQALTPTQTSNATATYTNYHVAALRLAAAFARDPSKQQALLGRAFAAEASALHFLQDSFSAGHFVGHWGPDANRLGTHDFYSGAGIETTRWADATTAYLAHGDAFLSDPERELVARAVKTSLAQVLLAARGEGDPIVASFSGVFGFEAYNSCKDEAVAPALAGALRSAWLLSVLRDQPAPAPRHPGVPRVHAEKGFFVGGAASTQGAMVLHENGFGARLLASLRLGFGAADVVNDPLNSQAFADAGFAGEHLFDREGTSLTGYAFRLRAPGYVCLVDGAVAIVLAQLLEGACPFCLQWATAAAGGGVGRIWQARHLAGTWYWQISALRDVALNYFHDEPTRGEYRTELQASVLTARNAVPISGSDGIAQSTDFYVDGGFSLTWSSGHHRAAPGAFLSLVVAPRLFLK
jgi:hypothetical protein